MGDGVGTNIPVISLPGKGAVVTGNEYGGRAMSKPAIKKATEKKSYQDIRTIPRWYSSPQSAHKEEPPKPKGPELRIETKVAGLEGKDVGAAVEMSIKGTLIEVRLDENRVEYCVEVESISI